MGSSESSTSDKCSSSPGSSYNNAQGKKLQMNIFQKSSLQNIKYYQKKVLKEMLQTWLGAYVQFGSKKQKVTAIQFHKHKLSKVQVTSFFMYHEFAVFQTEDRHWWSLQKNNSGILLQKSLDKQDVINKNGRTERTSQAQLLRSYNTASKDLSISDILEFSSHQIQEPYHIQLSNCQHFAESIRQKLILNQR